MAFITIDGKQYEYDGSNRNLLELCLSLGLDVPYFCWHPALGSVGACRQCAVKVHRDEKDTQGRIVMSCMTAATDGARISVGDPEARGFREQITEWLMVNHPHDCPVCDEGGECHLQDMTVMTGHVNRRARFPKRTFRNQNLGPFIAHEMNRCIQCYRCVRFYKDYAGGSDFGVFGWHDRLYFGRFEDGTLESPYSGNLVEICPTGVFTDKTFKTRSVRPWDLQTAPSVCEHCSLGCNTSPGERYGSIRRVRNRYNSTVNGYFLCDRGRFGHAYQGVASRLHVPKHRPAPGQEAKATSEKDVLERLVAALKGKRVLGVGSPRASLESNYALRELVGSDSFYLGLAARDLELLQLALGLLEVGSAPAASLGQARRSDAVLLLGEDVASTAPLLALDLRQASRLRGIGEAAAQRPAIPSWDDTAVRNFTQDKRGPFIVATPWVTAIEDLATRSLRAAPAEIARFGFAVAHALDPSLPAVSGLDPERVTLAQETAHDLSTAQRPLVVSGTGLRSPEVLQAASAVAQALVAAGRDAHIVWALPECNSMGAALLGASGSLEDVHRKVRAGEVDALVILENDLYRRFDAARVTDMLGGVDHVVVLDHMDTATTDRAQFVLPASTVAESEGTLVNNEGRAQRFFKVMQPQDGSRESWRWLSRLGAGIRGSQDGRSLDELLETLARAEPALAGVLEAAPPASFRAGGQKVPRQPARYTGRTAMHADRTVREPKPMDDPDSALSFTMEGFSAEAPASLSSERRSPGWNSVQALTKFQDEVSGPLHGGDPGVLLTGTGRGGPGAKRSPAPARIPEASGPRSGEWLVLPQHHVFGSSELAARAPAMVGRIPEPCVGLAAEDVHTMGLQEGAKVGVSVGGVERDLAVHVVAGLETGMATLAAGLPGDPWVELPAWGRVLIRS
jgi:NADH-quinone oxidoreductase subunit G